MEQSKDRTANLMQGKDPNHIWKGESPKAGIHIRSYKSCLQCPQAFSWLSAALSFYVLSDSCHKELALRHNKGCLLHSNRILEGESLKKSLEKVNSHLYKISSQNRAD